ncbi:MAG: hypothetical protein NPMRTHETA2_1260017 [Nitrosopumilales archaeon]|nr:MAG: hypothetical protein NPMRTHETA2_1260017 [Nitrosopumilales archaeon]
MIQSSYDGQILDILRLEGGRIVGFNTLKKLGITIRDGKPFHGNELKLAIERLKKSGQIKVNTIGNRGDKEYILPDQNIEKAYKKLTKEMQKMEMRLYQSGLKQDEKRLFLHNYFRLAFHNLDFLRYVKFGKDVFTKVKAPPALRKIEKLENKLVDEIQKKIDSLDPDEKMRIFNLLSPKEPELLSLEDYRKYTHIPTEKEKREEKLKLKQQRIEDHKNNPFCGHCGKKTKDYTEKDKHSDRHLKELVAMGLPWFIKKYGVGYNEKTGKSRKDKKLEKELKQIQKQ